MAAIDRWKQYTSAAGQTTFAYDFQIFVNTSLDVYQTPVGTTTPVPLTLTTDYTVTGVGNLGGGNIVLVAGATLNDIITVVGNTPATRITTFTNVGPLDSVDVNKEYTSQNYSDQQENRNLSRSITLHPADVAGLSMVLPLTADRADNYLKFDSSGNVTVIGGTSGAPTDATYITKIPTATLDNEFAMSTLTTGIVKNTTGTGTPSIAVQGTDYYAPAGTDVAVVDGGTGSSTAAGARTNLGLGTISTQDANAVAITGGTIAGITQLDVDNIRVDGNTISSTDANGDITLTPNGTGNVNLSSPEVFTSQADPTHTDGLLYYDSTDKALSFYNDDPDAKMRIGQENWVRVYNNSGATINNGSIVYATGKEDVEDRLTIGLAQADATNTSRVLGTATHDIENNTFGFVAQFGYVYDVDTSAFADGESMWLSPTVAGGFTNIEPVSPDVNVFLGYVVDSDVSGNGFITTIANTSGTVVAGDATQLVQPARKGTVGTINKGEVVYITGWNAGLGVVEVELADSDASATMPSLGVAGDTITNAVTGDIVLSGRLANVDTSTFAVGDDLYASGTPGIMTITKPTGAALIQKVAIVLRVHATLGVIMIVGAGRSNDIPNFSAADKMWYGAATGTQAETDISAFGRTLIDDAAASNARTTLGLVIGTDVQTQDAGLDDISGLAVTDSNFIVGDGANWVAETGATARTSLGLVIGTDVQAYNAELTAYDIGFIGGYDATMSAEDISVRIYGEIIIPRSFSITGESGYLETQATGSVLIVDIEKNGVTVYTTKPQFAVSTSTLTAGVLKTDGTEDFVAGNRLTFKVTQIGSTIAGARMRFTVKGDV